MTAPQEPPPISEKKPSPNRVTLQHSLRTALAALLSLLAARLFKLPQVYWAPITTIIILQSTIGAALDVSVQRIIGTALGAAAGALLVSAFGSAVLIFAAGVLGMGIICTLLRLSKPAFRFSGITLAIVMLNSYNDSIWKVAIHRFTEVSIGIAVGLLVTAIWPEG
ncbi:MAG: FUSC family protein [Tepidisphaeraceae bacterium]